MKNNIKKQAQNALAAATLRTAKTASTNFCFFFVHQPKVPAALRKSK